MCVFVVVLQLRAEDVRISPSSSMFVKLLGHQLMHISLTDIMKEGNYTSTYFVAILRRLYMDILVIEMVVCVAVQVINDTF